MIVAQYLAAMAYVVHKIIVPGISLLFYTFPVPTAFSTVGAVSIVGFTT
jgi:hypothetical protein